MKKISLKVIDSTVDLEEFEHEWEQFRSQLHVSSLCLSFTWINLWCHHYLKSQDRLMIHCYYLDEKLIGIFPVYLEKIILGYQLRFVAQGESQEAEICSEFQDFMLESKYQHELLTMFSQAVLAIDGIRACAFSNVLEKSVVSTWVKGNFSNWQVNNLPLGVRYLLPVAEDNLSQIERLKSKTTRRQAKEYFNNEYCLCEYVGEQYSLDSLFTELVSLHNESWQKRGQKGVFENQVFRDFHYQFATKANDLGKLALFKISYKDKTQAIFYGVIDADTLFYYQSGVLRSSKLLSAGIAMHMEALAFSQSRKLKYYDLMKGKSDSYKKKIVRGGDEVLNIIAIKRTYLWLKYFWKLKQYFLQIKRNT
jgi:CelD/BcsL family acetyltransferase involved in cellulose biosynthesis